MPLGPYLFIRQRPTANATRSVAKKKKKKKKKENGVGLGSGIQAAHDWKMAKKANASPTDRQTSHLTNQPISLMELELTRCVHAKKGKETNG